MTSNAIKVGDESHNLDRHGTNPSTWVQTWLAALKPNTATAYRRDLTDFAVFLGIDTLGNLAASVLAAGHADATNAVERYKATLIAQELSPATINRRLSTIRSLIRHAHEGGLIPWVVSTKGLKTVAYRDTSGPGVDVVRAIVQSLDTDSPKATRDRALVRLMFDMGMRRGEVVALDLDDIDLVECKAAVTAKGHRETTPLTIPTRTAQAIAAWITHRGSEPGPLFTNLDRAGKGSRLTGRSVGRIVAQLGERNGTTTVRPQGLRHSAITHALDQTNGNMRAARKFSRHVKIETLGVYDDNREDIGGELATLISESI